jgi:hypothetical protein
LRVSPALVPLLRERVRAKAGSLVEVADDVLVQLLTTIFWAGLETYEGERNPIGVAFLGTSGVDVVTSDVAGSDAPFLYQWKVQHFRSPRPFAVGELVKLAVAGADRRIYSAVNVMPDGSLVIAGLAREGFSVVSDPFVKIVTSRPGCLSIRSGRDSLLEYERGAILTGGDDLLFTAGLVRHALEETAHAADLDDDAVPDYVDAVRSLVREMAAHGRGGILIVSTEEWPEVAETATYRVAVDSSVASLLRLARRLGRTKRDESPQATDVAFGGLLRNAVPDGSRAAHRGARGARPRLTVRFCSTATSPSFAFGVMLPLGRPTALAEAEDPDGLRARVVDLGSRGTRHHAGATYAAEHPGSVVFVASEDGHVSCMLRDALHERTLLWRLGPAEVRTR